MATLSEKRSLTARPDTSRSRNQFTLAFRQIRRNTLATMGLILLVILTIIGLLAPIVAPYDPVDQELSIRVSAPTLEHPMGTDDFGRDVLSRIIYGTRVSLFVGLIVVGVAMILGVPIGLVAGYVGGRIDNGLMRAMDALLTFPPLLLAIALRGSLGPELRNVMLALGLVYTPVFARLVRGSTLSTREEDFIEAARSVGVTRSRILVFHVLPNVFGPLLVQATATFAGAIIAEASLSFLGLGVQPPTPSWGRDLNEARRYLTNAPWLMLAPVMAIMVSVLSINFLGDGLRDALDPRFRTQ
jgi:peptide/nickel transport system permease protein